MFWNSFSRMTFLAGLLQLDDESFKHTCSNMIQVVIGTDYIISFEEGEEVTQELIDYLGFIGGKSQVPDANHFYSKTIRQFPSLERRVGITVIPSYSQDSYCSTSSDNSGDTCLSDIDCCLPDTECPEGVCESFVGHAGFVSPGGLTSLFIESFKSTKCEFPLYSISEGLTAIVVLEVLI